MKSGFFLKRAFLSADEIGLLVLHARAVAHEAPFRTPSMPNGTPLSVKVTSTGVCGWWSDSRGGYRYVDKHPTTGKPFPPLAPWTEAIAQRALSVCGLAPMRIDTMLINFYDDGAKLGMHVDNTEDDKDAPIVSLSIGADAVFSMGGDNRSGPYEDHVVSTGDLIVQSGEARSSYHGIKKLLPTLISPLKTGRLNFTFRKVRM